MEPTVQDQSSGPEQERWRDLAEVVAELEAADPADAPELAARIAELLQRAIHE